MVVMPVRVDATVATTDTTTTTAPSSFLAVRARVAVHAPASRLAREYELVRSCGCVVRVDRGTVL